MPKEPILVLLAAGMGSRYGGLKQIDPVGPNGEILMDYSLYDAKKAGFKRIIFIIKKADEEDFEAAIGKRIRSEFDQVDYAYQELTDLPEGYSVPAGREKPWGTGHAVLVARDLIDAPFCVLNADDFYGQQAFQMIYESLKNYQELEPAEYTMIAYPLLNTLSSYGTVARGICQQDDGRLSEIVERTKIKKTAGGAAFTEDDGETWVELDPESVVSMNFWGFGPSFVDELAGGFEEFLANNLSTDPLKGEYLLPTEVDHLIQAGKIRVGVQACPEQWFGVTYREDKPLVVAAIQDRIDRGVYPAQLW